MKWFNTILAWLTPSQEAQEAALRANMQLEGYTDFEIEIAILEIRNHVQEPL